MAGKVYHIIKEIDPPVLVVMGKCPAPKRVLLCSGGKSYIDRAVKLTADFAAKVATHVSILHVMAEPPAVYLDLIEREENVQSIIESNSTLGRHLRSERAALEAAGMKAEIRLRHGLVVKEIVSEIEEGQYDMVVTGSAPGRAQFRTYMLGDVTSEIVRNADCAVLVVRAEAQPRGFFASLLRAFGRSEPAANGGQKSS